MSAPVTYPAAAGEDIKVFRDRADGARQLAARMKSRPFRKPVVLAIPRGGVVTGAVLAEELGAELDIVLARKLRAPGQPELALGAVSESGEDYLNPYATQFGMAIEGYLAHERQQQMQEIARRNRLLRGARPAASLEGRSVIVTDDGIATGSTMIAALKEVRLHQPFEVIAAVPVAAPESLELVKIWSDQVFYLLSPADFGAVGYYYEDFSTVEDEQVVAILRDFASANAGGPGNESPKCSHV